eukprot:TRINITY_DN12183_c0_g1_i4.p1 TRINITY_DN12183_c0_g1~~TRINITY_DN12183_c0_g1_i4.p1  ORF type:complete len:151 (-),score=35.70 TRINITY_DN12183_c0_g1_i4:486-938(-)
MLVPKSACETGEASSPERKRTAQNRGKRAPTSGGTQLVCESSLSSSSAARKAASSREGYISELALGRLPTIQGGEPSEHHSLCSSAKSSDSVKSMRSDHYIAELDRLLGQAELLDKLGKLKLRQIEEQQKIEEAKKRAAALAALPPILSL